MNFNLHTHSTFCDGAGTPEQMVAAALGKGFAALGFSSHSDMVADLDESSAWYREELAKTADAVAESGKIVEVNTGAISRGWMDDAYPSAEFRSLLRERGVRFVLSSDSHSPDTIDCAFGRFAAAEEYLDRLSSSVGDGAPGLIFMA